MTCGRHREAGASEMKIKIFRARCDMYSGETVSTILQLTKADGKFVCKQRLMYGVTPSSEIVFTASDIIAGTPNNIAFVMINPRTFEWYFGDNSNVNEIPTKLNDGYRLIVTSDKYQTTGNVLETPEINYYAFNNLTRMKIYSNSSFDENSPGNRDRIIWADEYSPAGKNYQTVTSDVGIDLYSISYTDRADNQVHFRDRRNNSLDINTTRQNRYKYSASLKNGVIIAENKISAPSLNGEWLPIPDWSPDWDNVMLNF
jgi:hypothetical protein